MIFQFLVCWRSAFYSSSVSSLLVPVVLIATSISPEYLRVCLCQFLWIKSLCTSENLGGWYCKLYELLLHEISVSQVVTPCDIFQQTVQLQKTETIFYRYQWFCLNTTAFNCVWFMFFKSLIAGSVVKLFSDLPSCAKVNESTSELINTIRLQQL